MNLPNKITLSRIFVVPIFMLFTIPIPSGVFRVEFLHYIYPQLKAVNQFIISNGNFIGAIIFIIAISTDGVDGYIARKKKLITKFGIFLDPIADKLLITAALIALVQRDNLTGWAAMIIISREFIVTALRLIAAGEGITIAASNWGKIKTVAQAIAIVASFLSNYITVFGIELDKYLVTITIIITVYSGYDYIKKNIQLIDYT